MLSNVVSSVCFGKLVKHNVILQCLHMNILFIRFDGNKHTQTETQKQKEKSKIVFCDSKKKQQTLFQQKILLVQISGID